MTPDPKPTEALKPCPCCGGGAEVMSRFDVKCTACGLEINSLSPERDWNTRATDRDAELAAMKCAADKCAERITELVMRGGGEKWIEAQTLLSGELQFIRSQLRKDIAAASTAGTELLERLRKAEEERDEACKLLIIEKNRTVTAESVSAGLRKERDELQEMLRQLPNT